ncbi:hypothetical protein GCM10008935_26610 [Alkalibacillus silvisoli]|uniref:Uncharacterized protein n=1 Tax=Alkalibacillus silvisoli TaxID=392823 RepID=A0ABP3K1Q5_9BACI
MKNIGASPKDCETKPNDTGLIDCAIRFPVIRILKALPLKLSGDKLITATVDNGCANPIPAPKNKKMIVQ